MFMRASVSLPIAALLLASACSQSRTQESCTTTAGCGPDAICVDGLCESPPAPTPIDAGNSDDAGAASDAGLPQDGGGETGTDAGDLDAGDGDAGVDGGAEDGGPGGDGGSVGYDGGTVDLLDFALTGDTRPGFCDIVSGYPTAIIDAEVAQMAALPSQFAADLGDHMFACLPVDSTATTQMALYVTAVSVYPRPWFMTMGNHECLSGLDCSTVLGDDDPNFHAFLAALPVVSHQSLPYYSIDIGTRFGLVRLIFIADNYSSGTAQVWLTSLLSDSDTNAVHTIVLKHHPYTGSDTGPAWVWPLLEGHKISLMLTAHEHDYAHNTTALDGRTVICGLGGASTDNTGFCRVQQRADNSLAFTEYDIHGNPLDTWSVPPL